MSQQEPRSYEVSDALDELARLAHEEIEPSDFYTELLGRASGLFPCASTSVWSRQDNRLQKLCQIGKTFADDESILPLLQHAFVNYEVRLVPAHFIGTESTPANPANLVLAIGPVVDEDKCHSVLMIALPAETSTKEHDSCFRLLSILCDIAVTYHRNGELRELRSDSARWRTVDDFAQAIHSTLQLSEASYLMANDGRQVIGCDRLTVFTLDGKKCRVRAVSGLEAVNRRSNLVRKAEEFASHSVRMNEVLKYPGTSELPPEVQRQLDAYLDESGTSTLTLVPLVVSSERSDHSYEASTEGVLLAENFTGTPLVERHVNAVAQHAARALRNCREHQRVFMLPLWAAIGNMAWYVRFQGLPKVAIAAAVFGALVAGAILVPADFELSADGTLQPLERNNIFAPADGVVADLNVQHLTHVNQGDVLARLESFEVELKLEEVDGELQTTLNKLRSLNVTRTDASSSTLTPTQMNRMAAEEEELGQWRLSLEKQRQLLLARQASLSIRAPIAGEVLTWDVENLLKARPVRKGQKLMTLAKLDGQWGLELHLKDHRVGHLRNAQQALGDQLNVSFIVATDPGQRFAGTVYKTDDVATLNADRELGLHVTVDINEDELSRLRAGAKVTAKIDCGRRPLGYVWLHEVFEFVQSKILFRMF